MYLNYNFFKKFIDKILLFILMLYHKFMNSKYLIFELLFKSIIASSIYAILFILVSLLMTIVSDGYQFIIIIPFSIFIGILISNISKNVITTISTVFLTILFTIIGSIAIYIIIQLITNYIKPIDDFILLLYKDKTFYNFIGNIIAKIMFVGFTLIIYVISLLLHYASKPK